ncbi:hypothetical protein Tsubulata_036205 [Turnera subulata]|uniref:NYN domain-containing protein n=1 Tax=Turnera subulata TaxID=218843 RepID=A0A9Q0JCI9_9ROSI|nr:hypothetical protein Tsubulata_036205 [Turnera subulata]
MDEEGGGGGGGGEAPYVTAKTCVWWDIENCAVPKSCDPNVIAKNISSALANQNFRGPVSVSAYGDTHRIPATVQHALSSTGVSLHHVPAGVKDNSDKKILVRMMLWALENPPPANYLLISGDRDFADALHQLRMRRYNILLAQPQKASTPLVAAANTVWLWTTLVAGGPPLISGESELVAGNGDSSILDSQEIPASDDAIKTQQPVNSSADHHLGTGNSKKGNGSKPRSKATHRNLTQADESKKLAMPVMTNPEVGEHSVLGSEKLANDCNKPATEGLQVPFPDAIHLKPPLDFKSENSHLGNQKSPSTSTGNGTLTKRKVKPAKKALNQTTGSKTSNLSVCTQEDQYNHHIHPSASYTQEPFAADLDFDDYWNIFDTSSFQDLSTYQSKDRDAKHGLEKKAFDPVSSNDLQDEYRMHNMTSPSHETLKSRSSHFPEYSPSSTLGKLRTGTSSAPESIGRGTSRPFSCACNKHSQDIDPALDAAISLKGKLATGLRNAAGSIRRGTSRPCSCHRNQHQQAQDVDQAIAIVIILFIVAFALIHSQY